VLTSFFYFLGHSLVIAGEQADGLLSGTGHVGIGVPLYFETEAAVNHSIMKAPFLRSYCDRFGEHIRILSQ